MLSPARAILALSGWEERSYSTPRRINISGRTPHFVRLRSLEYFEVVDVFLTRARRPRCCFHTEALDEPK